MNRRVSCSLLYLALHFLISGAFAQNQNTGLPVVCTPAAVPTVARAEGITELVGDMVLICTGGTPTVAGAAVPKANIQIFLNANVTSRILNTRNTSEALLLVDEPFPYAPSIPVPANVPPAPSAGSQLLCGSAGAPFNSSGHCDITGTGDGRGTYNGGNLRPNMFQGQQAAANSVAWLGIPIDPPGLARTRILRITNVRANAAQIGGSTLLPSPISMFIAVNGALQLITAQQIVAYVRPALQFEVTPAQFSECFTSGSLNVTVRENISDAFKKRNIAPPSDFLSTPAPLPQDIPGYAYGTESGFYNPALTGTAGLADAGTRIQLRFEGVGAGVSVFLPNFVLLQGGRSGLVNPAVPGGGLGFGFLALVSTDNTGTTVTAVYEVFEADTNALESATIPVSVFFTNTSTPGATTVRASLAPLSSVQTADPSAPVPRFFDTSTALAAFTIVPCGCNILFPFVTNQGGFDTGLVIANTTTDPFGTAAQSGTVTINYYGVTSNGSASPPRQVSQIVPPGGQLAFSLSAGGNFGVAATPGFQGYIIATAGFQFCHSYAALSDVGSNRVGVAYLGISLDSPGLMRTGSLGEAEGH